MNFDEQAPMRCIGLMSGTSLDGVDGVLATFPMAADGRDNAPLAVLAHAYVPFPDDLRAELMALQAPGGNEIHREALAANGLARLYAECIRQLLDQAGLAPADVRVAGVHGQTIRHRPGEFDGMGYTRQTNQPALVAELSGVDVIADFRSRDVAAGGQGAPLVPAFHQAMFSAPDRTRVVCNIGGISNLTILPAHGDTTGFDCGPGNALLDAWVQRHQAQTYDADGQWAASGNVDAALLAHLLAEPYFAAPPPKSTGRDLFNPAWLDARLAAFAHLSPADVQATLLALTAQSIADAVQRHAGNCDALFVCGGGARNGALMRALAQRLPSTHITTTADLGVAPQHVEALAFAWLARRCLDGLPGNLPAVTGARGLRVLGALYPR